MEAVNECQQDARDRQQKDKITSQNRIKRTTNTGGSQEGRHGGVNDKTKAKLNEELDRDYGDLEPSHENHMHNDWYGNFSERSPFFMPPPIEHNIFRSVTTQMLKDSLHITKTVATYIERKVHATTKRSLENLNKVSSEALYNIKKPCMNS